MNIRKAIKEDISLICLTRNCLIPMESDVDGGAVEKCFEIWEILKRIFELMKYEINKSREKAKGMFCFLKINSKRNGMIDESQTFNFYSIGKANGRRWFYYFPAVSGRRQIRGSHKYWWDSIKSSRRRKEEWLQKMKNRCERRITLFEDVPSQLNDSCHKRYWFMQIIIFV